MYRRKQKNVKGWGASVMNGKFSSLSACSSNSMYLFIGFSENYFHPSSNVWYPAYPADCRKYLLCLVCPSPNNAHTQRTVLKCLCLLIDNKNLLLWVLAKSSWSSECFTVNAHFICMTKQRFCITSLQKICRASKVFHCWRKIQQ